MNKKKIQHLEKIYNRHNEIIDNLQNDLEEFKKIQEEYQKLREYYHSAEFLDDYTSSNSEDVEINFPCGILSEDAIYNLIGENFNISIEMLEVATNVIKNH